MALMNGNYREYNLENGLVVALQNTPTQTVSGKLRVNSGASHEREGEEGLAHFLEHCLVTGGSEKYDPKSADDVRSSLGNSNAFTSIGRTMFVAEMLSEDTGLWLDYVSNHVFKPRFDSERFNGERERVLREISDAKSNPIYSSTKEHNQIFYGDHPKARFVLGKEGVVRDVSIDKMREFHQRGFSPNNMDLILVGGLPEDIEERVDDYFGQIPSGNDTRKDFPLLEHLKGKHVIHRGAPEKYNVDNPEESSADICFSYNAPHRGDEDEYAVNSMVQILGGGSNSLLFKDVSLRRGLAYNIGGSYSGNYNAGLLGVNATVPAGRIKEAVDAIFENFDLMKSQKPDEKLVHDIRKAAKFEVARAFESNEGHINAIENKMDDGLTPESFINGFDAVTPDRILEMSRKYLPDRGNGNYILYVRDPLHH